MDKDKPEVKVASLCFVQEPGRVLLGLKKRGFGMGRWNGFGGKMEPGETKVEGAMRELFEESGLRALDIQEAGFLRFELEGRPFTMEVDLFRITHYEGQPEETEEMRPQWFRHEDIPYDRMWNDDPYWLPGFLEGKTVHGNFTLSNEDKVVRHQIEFLG